MNSQFRNSNFGFILYTAIVTIIVLATGFVIWYMTIGYRVGTFGPDTRLGSVYIGGLTEGEVVPLLDERIDYWYIDDTIVFEIRYQGYSYEIDRNLLLFNLETSTYNLKDGRTNIMLAYFQEDDRQQIKSDIQALPFLSDIIGNVNVDQIILDILQDAALMKSYSSKDVENYLIEPELDVEELSSAHFSIPEGVQIDELIANVETIYEDGRILINSKELFDMADIFSGTLVDASMSTLASAMLETIWETNFIVNEVHYQPVIDFSMYTIGNYPYFGRNTIINQIVDEDFSFYNPNNFAYYFEIEKIDEFNGNLKLMGVPFEYTITVTKDITEIPFVTQGSTDVTLLQTGYNGVIVEVTRKIVDIYGVEIYDDLIIFEFYPPIKEIIYQASN